MADTGGTVESWQDGWVDGFDRYKAALTARLTTIHCSILGCLNVSHASYDMPADPGLGTVHLCRGHSLVVKAGRRQLTPQSGR